MNALPEHLSFHAESDADTQTLGASLANALRSGTIIYLFGTLGAGKTTFVRGFLRAIGFSGKVKSPTYTIVEPYETDKFEVFHFDLYRLNHSEELLQIGIETYFDGNAVCLIEWPDKGLPVLPAPDLSCYFDIIETGRQIRFESRTKNGEEILARL